MVNETLLKDSREFKIMKPRYESAKDVIRKLREQVIHLQGEGRLRIAAERLLGALLKKIDESKRSAYVEKMLTASKQTLEARQSLRPILMECDSISAVNRLIKVFKSSVTERATSRGLPPVTENGRRANRIPESSPLLESNDESQGPTSTPAATTKLQEQVDFTKMLVHSMKGNNL